MIKYISIKESNLCQRKWYDNLIYYSFYIWWNWLDMLPRRIYWFFQRGYRGFGDNDTWDFNDYLSLIIPQGIKHLKKYSYGLPTWTEDKSEKQAKKEWNEIQNKIIKAFELAHRYINAEISCKTWEKKYKKQYEEGMNLFRDWFFALWD